MIIFSLRVKLPSVKKTIALQTLWQIAGPTGVQPGCLSYRIYSDTQDDDTLFLRQVWETRESLERYVASDEFRSVLAAMDLASTPPEIGFHTVSQTNGLEFVEAVRLKGNEGTAQQPRAPGQP